MDPMHDALRNLIEEYRSRCLWFFKADYFPASRDEILRTLDFIERYGDRAAYRRAEEIRAWLSQTSRQTS